MRYAISYRDISIYLYYFTEIGYDGSANSSNPDTVYIPLPEIPTNLDQYHILKMGAKWDSQPRYGKRFGPDHFSHFNTFPV